MKPEKWPKMINRTSLQVVGHELLFQTLSKRTLIYPDGKVIEWIPFDYIEGNEGMFFVRLDGDVPMGLTKYS